MTSEEKASEEAKRDAVLAKQDALAKWEQLKADLTAAEAALPPHLRRNRPRVHPSQRTAGTEPNPPA